MAQEEEKDAEKESTKTNRYLVDVQLSAESVKLGVQTLQ